MPDPQEPTPHDQPPLSRKNVGLTFGKAIGEALEWGKVATVAAECVIGVVVALILAVAINFFFGKEVEVTEKKSS